MPGQEGANSVYAFMLGSPRFFTRDEFKAGFRAALDMEIERLIDVADAIDGDADEEPYLGTFAEQGGTDDREAESEHDEDDAIGEPSLALPEHHSLYGNTSFGYVGVHDDREADAGDEPEADPAESGVADTDALQLMQWDEPTLGATEAINQDEAWPEKASTFANNGESEPMLGWCGNGTGYVPEREDGVPRVDDWRGLNDEREDEDEHGVDAQEFGTEAKSSRLAPMVFRDVLTLPNSGVTLSVVTDAHRTIAFGKVQWRGERV